MSTKPQSSTYVESAPTGPARPHVACTWVGITGNDGGYTDRVLPDACVDVIWDGARVFVAGPDTGPVMTNSSPGTTYAGVRLRPGHAAAVLARPANELTDRRVDARDIWPERQLRRWEDQLGGRTPFEATRLLESIVTEIATETDTDVASCDAIARVAARGDVADMADELGCTPRTLHRRCVQSFGYGPKTLHRILRFRRFMWLAERDSRAQLSTLAVDAGYADQPHLTRDCNDLAGLAPRPLLLSRGVRSVQDTA
ncbi:MAG TPA: helix-turn-helix domain-containing protein [Acidimicrobiia bacterium]